MFQCAGGILIWKTQSCRNIVTDCPKPSKAAETLKSNFEVEKLITAIYKLEYFNRNNNNYKEKWRPYRLRQILCRHSLENAIDISVCRDFGRNGESLEQNTSRERQAKRKGKESRRF